MLTYTFSPQDGPLYQQLYALLRRDLLAGVIAPGERLPSKRALAKNLGISVITVENTYAQLVAEGYVLARPRQGYFAAPLSPGLPLTPGVPAVSAAPPPPPALFADLAGSHTRPERFPFAAWARCSRAVLSQERAGLLTPCPAAGTWALREAIAGHLRQFHAMTVFPEQIVVGAGGEYLYGLLIQLLGRERGYALEEPGYAKPARIYRSWGARVLRLPLDEAGLPPQALVRCGAQVAHVTPSHHFPTGITMPIARRQALLHWAAEDAQRFIIEDDYDCEFRLAGRPVPSLMSIDRTESVIYMNTFTKSLASTIRIGYLVLPPRLVELFDRRLGFQACTVSQFEQYTLARFIREGHFEKHLSRTRTFCRTQRDLLLGDIKQSPLAAISGVSQEDAGLHFLLTVDTPLSDEALCRRAACRGLGIRCLSQYYTDPTAATPHVLVISYAGLDPLRRQEAVARLWDCLAP